LGYKKGGGNQSPNMSVKSREVEVNGKPSLRGDSRWVRAEVNEQKKEKKRNSGHPLKSIGTIYWERA